MSQNNIDFLFPVWEPKSFVWTVKNKSVLCIHIIHIIHSIVFYSISFLFKSVSIHPIHVPSTPLYVLSANLYFCIKKLVAHRGEEEEEEYLGGYSKTRYKKLFTRAESHASAVSLLKSGEERYIKAINIYI